MQDWQTLSVFTYAAQTLTFTIKALPSAQSSVKFAGGAVSAAVADASQGLGAPLINAISPGAQLASVALFIDQNQQSLAKPAAAEWGWGGSFDNSQGWGGW